MLSCTTPTEGGAVLDAGGAGRHRRHRGPRVGGPRGGAARVRLQGQEGAERRAAGGRGFHYYFC